jgi:hypothetical protein
LKLGRVLRRLRKAEDGKTDFSKIFSTDRTLAHLWREYRHTLHEQKEINPQTGQQEIAAFRATVPAETFFSTKAWLTTGFEPNSSSISLASVLTSESSELFLG